MIIKKCIHTVQFYLKSFNVFANKRTVSELHPIFVHVVLTLSCLDISSDVIDMKFYRFD